MFAIDDSRYEAVIFRSYLGSQLAHLLAVATQLGAPAARRTVRPLSPRRDGAAQAQPKSTRPHASSTSTAFALIRCQEILSVFRKNIGDGAQSGKREERSSAAYAQRQQKMKHSLIVAKTLAEDEATHPKEKLAQLEDHVQRIIDDENPVWEGLVDLLACRGALIRLLDGDWSIDTAHAELDQAVALYALHAHRPAHEHACRCREILKRVQKLGDGGGDGPTTPTGLRAEQTSNYRRKRVEALGTLVEAATLDDPQQAAARLKPLLNSGGPFHDPFCAALVHYGAVSDVCVDHDAISASHSRCVELAGQDVRCRAAVTIRTIQSHLDIVARADAELRGPAVKAAREKLLERVRTASSQRELCDINADLRATVRELQSRSEGLQLSLVRQTNIVDEAVRSFLDFIREALSNSITASEAKLTALLQLVQFRVLATAGRASPCAKLAGNLCSLVEYFFPDSTLTQHLLLDAAMALACRDVSQYPVAPRELRIVVEETLSDRNPLSLSQRNAFELHGVQIRHAVDHAEESEDMTDLAHLAARLGERAVYLTFASSNPANRSASSPAAVNALRTLCETYRKLNDSSGDVRCQALLCAVLAEYVGPAHDETVAELKNYISKRQKVHAPTFDPCWGVQCFRASVTLTCDTEGADIYFSIGDHVPLEDVGVHESSRYSSPITLDKPGRLKIRAFAVKNGVRSGVVEARYYVLNH